MVLAAYFALSPVTGLQAQTLDVTCHFGKMADYAFG
jgi:hypothetical protein